MKVEIINLHGLNLNEAREKVQRNLEWAIKHEVEVLVINHGKGLHSSGFAVLKTEIRNLLKADLSLRKNNYLVVYGESNLPIALTFNEGNTLIVACGLENQPIGGQAQQTKNQRIFSEEGKQTRKAQKRWRHDH
ncbi:MAG: Smr/MutS family protein [Firmicutes bacterium]|nr:Smr/MutS family protein [Bacillota bacterium]